MQAAELTGCAWWWGVGRSLKAEPSGVQTKEVEVTREVEWFNKAMVVVCVCVCEEKKGQWWVGSCWGEARELVRDEWEELSAWGRRTWEQPPRETRAPHFKRNQGRIHLGNLPLITGNGWGKQLDPCRLGATSQGLQPPTLGAGKWESRPTEEESSIPNRGGRSATKEVQPWNWLLPVKFE